MVEVYGKEASGKRTLALHIIKEAQKLGGYCAYLVFMYSPHNIRCRIHRLLLLSLNVKLMLL
ncbi:hypothetical protein DY000_02051022 [Brassica cretica]|uniref:RecA-like N-terminal domain-containing protein n=1 Tax=Brassica cretica TaxID=69181 RepID=A0ABQ7F708_BRACR|nr:hypothetical protein DY000_02051022 [Brassica cretica]